MLGLRSQWVEVGDVDVDIGGNPSAEEAEEALESGAKKVVDLQDAFRLQEGPSYSKKELMTYLKARPSGYQGQRIRTEHCIAYLRARVGPEARVYGCAESSRNS